MPIPVKDIINRVGIMLNDVAHIRWPINELLDWINDAAGDILIRKSSARSVTIEHVLVEGVIQKLPADSLRLLDVTRNVGGASISRVMRSLLDGMDSNWYQMPPERTRAIKHFILEESTPKDFYVYPPAREGMKVEIKVSQSPPKVTSENDTLDLDRAYISPIVNYVMFRSYAKDAEFANGALGITYYNAFTESLSTDVVTSSEDIAKAGQA